MGPLRVESGQKRSTLDWKIWIIVGGCYGSGSGGLLYGVSLENSELVSPNGMSERDIEERYPNVITGAVTQ